MPGMTNTIAEGAPGRLLASLRLIALAFVVLALAGCNQLTEIVPPGAYSLVDQAAEELDLETAGDIEFDFHRGGQLVGDGATYVAIVSGDDVLVVLEGRLSDLGYTYDEGSETWERGGENESLTVTLNPVSPGHVVNKSDTESLTVEHAGASVAIVGP